jgi:hypothetical protein
VWTLLKKIVKNQLKVKKNQKSGTKYKNQKVQKNSEESVEEELVKKEIKNLKIR